MREAVYLKGERALYKCSSNQPKQKGTVLAIHTQYQNLANPICSEGETPGQMSLFISQWGVFGRKSECGLRGKQYTLFFFFFFF